MYKFKLSVTIHHWRLNLKEIGYQRPNAQCILAVVLGGTAEVLFSSTNPYLLYKFTQVMSVLLCEGVVMND